MDKKDDSMALRSTAVASRADDEKAPGVVDGVVLNAEA